MLYNIHVSLGCFQTILKCDLDSQGSGNFEDLRERIQGKDVHFIFINKKIIVSVHSSHPTTQPLCQKLAVFEPGFLYTDTVMYCTLWYQKLYVSVPTLFSESI